MILSVFHKLLGTLTKFFLRMQCNGGLLDGLLHPGGQGLEIGVGFHILGKIRNHNKAPFHLDFMVVWAKSSCFIPIGAKRYYFHAKAHILKQKKEKGSVQKWNTS